MDRVKWRLLFYYWRGLNHHCWVWWIISRQKIHVENLFVYSWHTKIWLSIFCAKFTNAELLICLFHTVRSFRREITTEKMVVTSGQISMCLELVHQMAYAPSEKYQRICSFHGASILQWAMALEKLVNYFWDHGKKVSVIEGMAIGLKSLGVKAAGGEWNDSL